MVKWRWVPGRLKGRLHVSAKEMRMILLVSLLFMAGALAFVWPSVKMVKLAFDHEILNEERRTLLQENRLLKLESQSLRSLDRIQTLALSRLGLQHPGKKQIVTVFLK